MRLHADNIVVRYGGVTAVDGVSVAVDPGAIVAVIGPNGSGKSTLFNAITGLAPTAQGAVSVGETSLLQLPMHKRVELGISRTFQTPRFDPEMSVEQTMLCGYFPRRKAGLVGSIFRLPAAAREAREFRERCRALIDSFSLGHLARTPMAELPIGQIRLVDVARAMAADPRFLLLDEPAAGISLTEQKMLSAEIRRVAGLGVGVLLVEHNFDLVCQLAEQLVVLERGKVLMTGTPGQISADPSFRRAYLGTEATVGGLL